MCDGTGSEAWSYDAMALICSTRSAHPRKSYILPRESGGEGQSDSCPQNYKFTGKERDGESGLDYFGARYYSSSLGRFMTPDWAAKAEPVPYAKLPDPQSLNLYGYVHDDPVTSVDADGHECPVCDEVEEAAQEAIDRVVKPLVESAAPEVKGAASSALGATVGVVAAILASPQDLNSGENAMLAKMHAAAASPQAGHRKGARPSTREKAPSRRSAQQARQGP